jgi:hypothetical protein
VLFERWLKQLNRSKQLRKSSRVIEMTQQPSERPTRQRYAASWQRARHNAQLSHIFLEAPALSIRTTTPNVAILTAGLQRGVFAVRQRIATWLFLSHTGKSPRSTQQFAAIGTLINFEFRIGTFGLHAKAAEASGFIGSS